MTHAQERNEGGKVAQFPGRQVTMGRRITAGGDVEKTQQCHNASISFNTVHLLPKDLWFEHGDAKLASCPGLRLWRQDLYSEPPIGPR